MSRLALTPAEGRLTKILQGIGSRRAGLPEANWGIYCVSHEPSGYYPCADGGQYGHCLGQTEAEARATIMSWHEEVSR